MEVSKCPTLRSVERCCGTGAQFTIENRSCHYRTRKRLSTVATSVTVGRRVRFLTYQSERTLCGTTSGRSLVDGQPWEQQRSSKK